MKSGEVPAATRAARLALLDLRAGLPEDAMLVGDAYRLNGDHAVLTADEAASTLSQIPKPVMCTATAKDGIVDVACTRLTDPEQLRLHEGDYDRMGFGGFVASMLREHYGPNIRHLRVMWIGRAEQLVFSVEEMDAFYRDYELPANSQCACGWIDGDYARRHLPAGQNAEGAVVLVRCLPVRRNPFRRSVWRRVVGWVFRPLARVLFLISRRWLNRMQVRWVARRVGRAFLSPMNYGASGRVVDQLLAVARATNERQAHVDLINGVIDPPGFRTPGLETAVASARTSVPRQLVDPTGLVVTSARMIVDFDLERTHHDP